jgi:hypothetical protein
MLIVASLIREINIDGDGCDQSFGTSIHFFLEIIRRKHVEASNYLNVKYKRFNL